MFEFEPVDSVYLEFSFMINRKRRVQTTVMFGKDFSILIRAFESHALIISKLTI